MFTTGSIHSAWKGSGISSLYALSEYWDMPGCSSCSAAHTCKGVDNLVRRVCSKDGTRRLQAAGTDPQGQAAQLWQKDAAHADSPQACNQPLTKKTAKPLLGKNGCTAKPLSSVECSYIVPVLCSAGNCHPRHPKRLSKQLSTLDWVLHHPVRSDDLNQIGDIHLPYCYRCARMSCARIGLGSRCHQHQG